MVILTNESDKINESDLETPGIPSIISYGDFGKKSI